MSEVPLYSPGTAAVGHGRITCSRMEKTAHSVTRGSGLELDRCHDDPIPPFVGEEVNDRASRSG